MKSMKLKDVTFKSTNEQMGINNGSSVSPKVMEGDSYEQPEYPYGLRICLDSDVLKALGFTELPAVGTKLEMEAMVEVCSASMTESKEYGKKLYMDLQIVEMELEKSKEDPAKKLYEDSEKYD